jgi:hypothetical protein
MAWTPVAQLALPLCAILWMFLRERTLVRETLWQNAEGPGSCSNCHLTQQDARQAA